MALRCVQAAGTRAAAVCWPVLRRWLYVAHRWMGIAGCLLIAMWFGSGLVMLYVGFPALTEPERLAGLPPLDLGQVSLTPAAAMAAAGVPRFPQQLRLEMAGAEPVYRMVDHLGQPRTVSARDGRVIQRVDRDRAVAIASAFTGRPALWIETIERDQWTVPQGLDAWRPLHRIAIRDGHGTQVYVSARTGEVVRDTDRAERCWNWLGAVPHWIYFTPLRQHPPLWRQVILWTSGACVAVAVSGIWIGLLRVRLRGRRYASGTLAGRSPYRGWMAWHHLAGLLGGLFLVSWLASGWLSVNPNRWFDTAGFDSAALQRYAGHGSPTYPSPNLADLSRSGADLRELRMAWVAGTPVLLLATGDGSVRALDPVGMRPIRWAPDRLAATAARLVPGARVADVALQTQPDRYWYSHHQLRSLPVLRVRLDDAGQTWVYIDPGTGLLAGHGNASRRAYRWLFHAAHSWDLRPLLAARPAWDIVMWTLSLTGLAVSVSGIVIGWRRLWR